MQGRMMRNGRAADSGSGAAAEELDDRTRQQYLAVLQYLKDHELWETLAALESETGLSYSEGALPIAGVLEASLDMFARYHAEQAPSAEDVAAREAEEALLKLERGACCTGPHVAGQGPPDPLGANVTAVAWAAVRHEELLTLVATADRRLRLLGGPDGEVLTELEGLTSPLLGLDVSLRNEAAVAAAGGRQEVLATSMGGEVFLIALQRPAAAEGQLVATAGDASQGWSLEIVQRFRDHSKHVSSGRFAPTTEEGARSQHFVTVSRDHQARLYARGSGEGGTFISAGVIRMVAEVTCCSWVNDRTFILAARDDHCLHYWDVDGNPDGGPQLRTKVNMNALGDSIVSFAVLSMAVSPDGSLVAVCTDKSRSIIFQAFTARQLRNLYGAQVDEYDIPSICFSHDQTFVYVTSTLSHAVRRAGDDAAEEELLAPLLPGEVAVFEVSTGERVLRLQCHGKPVRCMERHPHSELLVTGSFDKTVKYWG